MNRGQRNNSPVNLKFAHQRESTGPDDKGFAVFPTPEAGWRAAMAQIFLDASRGMTLGAYIYKFAPPSENETQKYLDYIVGKLFIDPKINLGSLCIGEDMMMLVDIVVAQAEMEGWFAK